MDEQKIRAIIQEEIRKNGSNSRFTQNPVQRHIHNGLDSPQLTQNNIIPGVSVSGSISMQQEAVYTLNLNGLFTPTTVTVSGVVVDNPNAPTIRAFFYGSAQLGPSFYFQPLTNTSVQTGTLQFPRGTPEFPNGSVPVQHSVYTSTKSDALAGGVFHALADEGHIVDVEYSGIHARATITNFSRTAVEVTVSDLDSGWAIIGNWVIT